MNGKELKYLKFPLDPLIPLTTGYLPLDTVLTVNTDGDPDNDIPLFYLEEPFDGFPTRARVAPTDPAAGVTDLETLKDIKNTDSYLTYIFETMIAGNLESDEYLAFKATDPGFLRFLASKAYQRFISSSAYLAFKAAYDSDYFLKPSHTLYIEALEYLNSVAHDTYFAYQQSPEYLLDKEFTDYNNDFTGVTAYTESTPYLVYLDQVAAYDAVVARPQIIKYTTKASEVEW